MFLCTLTLWVSTVHVNDNRKEQVSNNIEFDFKYIYLKQNQSSNFSLIFTSSDRKTYVFYSTPLDQFKEPRVPELLR